MSDTRRGSWGIGLALLALGLAVYLPGIGLEELDNEEGRRALPAREMLASGEWIVPTLFGNAYLAKPPLYYWLVAGISWLAGGVTEWTLRFPSAVASALTAVLVWRVGRRWLSERAGVLAGLLCLAAPYTIQKGTDGELEPLLALLVLASGAGMLELTLPGGRRRFGFALAAGGLAAAMLCKGPPVLLFHLGLAAALARTTRSWRPLVGPAPLAVLAIGVAPLLAWSLEVASRLPERDVVGFWAGEVGDRGWTGLGPYLFRRYRLALELSLGFLPSFGLVAIALADRDRRKWLASDAVRSGLWTCLLVAVPFLLWPRTASRYLYPCGPWLALGGGAVLAAAMERWESAGRGVRRFVALFGNLAALFGALVALALVGVPVVSGSPGILVGAPVALLFAAAFLARRGRRNAIAAMFVTLLLARLAYGLLVMPGAADRYGRRAAAAEIATHAPPDRPLRVAAPAHYNLLFYVDAELVWCADPEADLQPGDRLLVVPAHATRLLDRDAAPHAWRRVTLLEPPRDGALVLLETQTR